MFTRFFQNCENENFFLENQFLTMQGHDFFTMLKWNNRSNHHRCSIEKAVLKIFKNTYTKIPVLKSLFNKVAGTSLKDSNASVFLWICEFFKNTYFEEHLWRAASGINRIESSKPFPYWVSLSASLKTFTILWQTVVFTTTIYLLSQVNYCLYDCHKFIASAQEKTIQLTKYRNWNAQHAGNCNR